MHIEHADRTRAAGATVRPQRRNRDIAHPDSFLNQRTGARVLLGHVSSLVVHQERGRARTVFLDQLAFSVVNVVRRTSRRDHLGRAAALIKRKTHALIARGVAGRIVVLIQ